MAVGWILFKTNFKIQMSRVRKLIDYASNRIYLFFLPQVQKLTGWFISLSTLFVLVYGLYKIEMSKEVAALHSALSHTLWALGLAWVVIACATSNGGIINDLLSAPCLYPFSRVTYCVYLVHPVVIRTFVVSSDTPFHLDEVSTVIELQLTASQR
jgi:peptidoglycan/LPS O-acetylase OafA/YrhL